MSNSIPATKAPLYSMAFFDTQNLYRHAREAFEQSHEDPYHHPSFDPLKLHLAVANKLGYKPNLTRFYSGIPEASDHEMWGGYWAARKLALTRGGVLVTTRRLRYHTQTADDGTELVVPQEKGIDVRIALDLVSCARRKEFDAAIIFSQDQDLAEAVLEIRSIAKEQKREIKLVSAFPDNPQARRGIDRTDWFRIDKALYDSCLDPRDYRPAKFRSHQA